VSDDEVKPAIVPAMALLERFTRVFFPFSLLSLVSAMALLERLFSRGFPFALPSHHLDPSYISWTLARSASDRAILSAGVRGILELTCARKSRLRLTVNHSVLPVPDSRTAGE
jgi:hypothetical protein